MLKRSEATYPLLSDRCYPIASTSRLPLAFDGRALWLIVADAIS